MISNVSSHHADRDGRLTMLSQRMERRRPLLQSHRVHGLVRLRQRQADVKYRAAPSVVLSPYPAPVSFDDGARNGQAHAHTVALGREERLEYLVQLVGRDARTGIGYRNLR